MLIYTRAIGLYVVYVLYLIIRIVFLNTVTEFYVPLTDKLPFKFQTYLTKLLCILQVQSVCLA